MKMNSTGDLTNQAPFQLLLTPRQAAKTLSICERTLYGLTKRGEVPAIRIGRAVRYSVDDLKDWIKKSSENA